MRVEIYNRILNYPESESHISQRCESRNAILLIFVTGIRVTSRRDVRVEIRVFVGEETLRMSHLAEM